jgi:hypothetical protein
VKRPRVSEPIEEIEFEFTQGGTIKRRKLVTEKEALINKFNRAVSLEDRIIIPEETKDDFTLGILPQKHQNRSVTIRRLMPEVTGKSEE